MVGVRGKVMGCSCAHLLLFRDCKLVTVLVICEWNSNLALTQVSAKQTLQLSQKPQVGLSLLTVPYSKWRFTLHYYFPKNSLFSVWHVHTKPDVCRLRKNILFSRQRASVMTGSSLSARQSILFFATML